MHDPDWYDRTSLAARQHGRQRDARLYGVPDAGWASAAASHDAFAAAFPHAQLAFLDACGLYRRVGGYLFVHAGIRPGVRSRRSRATT